MFANFTEETCTGTGDTMALAGATTGNIAFSESFADGQKVAYVIEDSGGTIKVAGIGTYVSATDDITREDSWTWNGTVIDTNPSSNLTLSGGTHTIRCDATGAQSLANLAASGQDAIRSLNAFDTGDNIPAHNSTNTPTANRLTWVAVYFVTPRIMTEFFLDVTTADGAATNFRQGVYAPGSDGRPGALLADSGNIDVSSTGVVRTTLSKPLVLSQGYYFFGVVTDSTTVRVRTTDTFLYPLGSFTGRASYSSNRVENWYQDSVTGALPDPASPTSSDQGATFCVCAFR